MTELNKEDLAWIFEVCILNFENKPLTEMISQIPSKDILIGKETLEFIKTKWEKQ